MKTVDDIMEMLEYGAGYTKAEIRSALNEYKAEIDKYKALKVAISELIKVWETSGWGYKVGDIEKFNALIEDKAGE